MAGHAGPTIYDYDLASVFPQITRSVTGAAAAVIDVSQRPEGSGTNDNIVEPVTVNIVDREAERRLLPLARDHGIAVIVNRPFQTGGLFSKYENETLPDWAGAIDCAYWSQFFLKFVISHPAVTCTIPATSRVDHLRENMAAGRGRLPDEAMRAEMIQYIEKL